MHQSHPGRAHWKSSREGALEVVRQGCSEVVQQGHIGSRPVRVHRKSSVKGTVKSLSKSALKSPSGTHEVANRMHTKSPDTGSIAKPSSQNAPTKTRCRRTKPDLLEDTQGSLGSYLFRMWREGPLQVRVPQWTAEEACRWHTSLADYRTRGSTLLAC